jgi:hypothetical protein
MWKAPKGILIPLFSWLYIQLRCVVALPHIRAKWILLLKSSNSSGG